MEPGEVKELYQIADPMPPPPSFALFADAPTPQACFLTQAGQGKAAIVTGRDSGPFYRWVANEVQYYLRELTGAELPIVTSEAVPAGKPLIVLGGPQLITGAGDVVQGFDPDSGERLWTARSPGEGVVPSIVCGQNLVFTSSGYGALAIRVIRPDGHGEVTSTHIAWESRDSVPLVPSFPYADGLLFCVQETGIATCRDAATGRMLWKQRLSGTHGASPVLAEGRLYFLAEDGSTAVIAARREFKELARNPLEGPCKASPAIFSGRIFIRSRSSLFCIREGKDASPPRTSRNTSTPGAIRRFPRSTGWADPRRTRTRRDDSRCRRRAGRTRSR